MILRILLILLAGKLGQGHEENVAIPCNIPAFEDMKMVHIAAGCEHSAAINSEGVLFTWGHGDGGRLGHGDNNQVGALKWSVGAGLPIREDCFWYIRVNLL